MFILLIGLLLNDDTGEKAAVYAKSSEIFEEVSDLEALELGILDGDTLREEHGMDSSENSEAPTEVEVHNTTVSMTLRSVQDDIKIKIVDSDTQLLVAGVPFTVTVKGKDKTLTYTDNDKDGVIYIPYVSAGDYTVFLSDITESNVSYSADKSQTITVSDSIEYAKIDIKDEMKTEADINVAEEDTKVQDEDQTTEQGEDDYVSYEEEVFDEGISDEAEDLLAQIESDVAAEEASKAAIKGASSGTVTAPTKPAADPAYAEVHSGSKGVDVSKHNGNIDWGAVKNSGIEFAIIRCGYRGSSSGALVIDPLYAQNIIAAQNAGLKVGVYFFSQAINEVEAVEEASMVLELIKGQNLQMPVYIDVEKSRGRGDQISVEQRSAVCNAFLTTIKNAGYTAGIYSNKLWFEGMINTKSFLDYKLWLAQYVDIPTYTATRYDMWQYTSKGSVPGIAGNVDMNVLK